MRSLYVVGPECGAKDGHPRFLCAASSISPWRLRELEVPCANSEGSLVAQDDFENGTWGSEIRRESEPQAGEIVVLEHWGSSGFANTDLDLQLERHGIHQLIVMGLIAHTCVEATVRHVAEFGYEVTMVQRRDGELLG